MSSPAHPIQNLSFIALPVLAQGGKASRYSVVDTQGQPNHPEKSVRIGNDLVLTLENGMEVVLKNFFLAAKAVRTRPAPSDNQDASEAAPQWLQFENGHRVAKMDGAKKGAMTDGMADGHTSILFADASQFAGLQYQYQGPENLLLAQADLVTDTNTVTDTVADPVTEAAAASPVIPPGDIAYYGVLDSPQVRAALAVVTIGGVAIAAGGGSGSGGNSLPVSQTGPTISSGALAQAIAEKPVADQVVYTADSTASGVIYSLKSSTGDVSAFAINGSSGAVTLTGNPDYETQASYRFTVIATDAAGNTGEKAVTLAVANLDDTAPTFSSGTTATAIAENSGANQVVYTAAATDTDFIAPNTASSVSYSLKPDVGDASAFTIDSSTGEVRLRGNPDFETRPGNSYRFTVIATDAAGNAREQAVTLAITNVDESAPTFSRAGNLTIVENTAAGKVVYTARATDTDYVFPATASSVSYSLKAGTGDAAAFSIHSSSGKVTLTSSPDYETKARYSFAVIATDAAGNTSEQAVTLVVINLDETAATFSSAATATPIAENSAASQVVYTAVATDADFVSPATASSVSYSLKENTDDAAAFTIASHSGAVTLTASPDFETKSSYRFTVIATDATGKTSEQAVTLAVTNLDDAAPTFSSGDTATAIAENSGAGQVVYTAVATDTDFPGETGSVSYSLKANTGDEAAFSIDSSTGAVTLTASPDFEAMPSYRFTVVAADAAGNATERPVTLAITNVNDVGPVITGIPATVQTNSVNLPSRMDNFSVADVDSSTLYVTLTPTNGSIGGFTAGTLNGLNGLGGLRGLSGLTIAMDGNSIQLTGPATLINTALENATFASSTTGAGSVSVRVSDTSLADTAASTSSTATYHFNTVVPLLRIKDGQDAFINRTETGIDMEVTIDSLVAGDIIIQTRTHVGDFYRTIREDEASTHIANVGVVEGDVVTRNRVIPGAHDGQKTYQVILVVGDFTSASNIVIWTVDDKVPTLDLNGAVLAGNDTSTTINTADLVSFGSSTAILPNVAAVTDADVLKIVLDFADTAANNAPKPGDHLKIGSMNGSDEYFNLNSAVNLGTTTGDLTLGGQSGLDYSYEADTHKLTLFKHDGSVFDASNIDGVLKAMQFMSSASPVDGQRDFSVHLIDQAGNDGSAAAHLLVQAVIPA